MRSESVTTVAVSRPRRCDVCGRMIETGEPARMHLQVDFETRRAYYAFWHVACAATVEAPAPP